MQMVPQSTTSSYGHFIHFRDFSASIEEKRSRELQQLFPVLGKPPAAFQGCVFASAEAQVRGLGTRFIAITKQSKRPKPQNPARTKVLFASGPALLALPHQVCPSAAASEAQSSCSRSCKGSTAQAVSTCWTLLEPIQQLLCK